MKRTRNGNSTSYPMRCPNSHTLYLLLVQPDLSFPRLFIWCLWPTTLSENASGGFKIKTNVLSFYSVTHSVVTWNVLLISALLASLVPSIYPIVCIFLLFLPKHPGSLGHHKTLSPTLNKQFLIQLISLDVSFAFLFSTTSKKQTFTCYIALLS